MATQYYTPNQTFQISSLQQLKSVESDNYTWAGRTLTGWLDSENRVHEISSDAEISTSFPSMTAGISGLWELNRFSTFLSVISNENDPTGQGGTLSCVWYKNSDYYPLPSPPNGTFELSNNQINSERYYRSPLSIWLIAKEGFIPTTFKWMNSIYNKWNTVSDPKTTCFFDDWGSGWNYNVESSISVIAEFNKGVLTYYSGKNTPSPVL